MIRVRIAENYKQFQELKVSRDFDYPMIHIFEFLFPEKFVGYLKRHPWVSFQVAIGMKTATPPRTIDTRTDNLPELAIPVLIWPQVTK